MTDPDAFQLCEGLTADEFSHKAQAAVAAAMGPALEELLRALPDDKPINTTLTAQAAAVGIGIGLAPAVNGLLHMCDYTVPLEQMANVIAGALIQTITEINDLFEQQGRPN